MPIDAPPDRMVGILGVIKDRNACAGRTVLQPHVEIDPFGCLLLGFIILLTGGIEHMRTNRTAEGHPQKQAPVGVLLDFHVRDRLERPIQIQKMQRSVLELP